MSDAKRRRAAALVTRRRRRRRADGRDSQCPHQFRLNQSHGFDCPGCAWPDPDRRKHAEFCENGAKAVAEEATRRRIDRRFFAEHSIDELACESDHFLSQQGRLVEPVIRRPGSDRYEPIGWNEAITLIAEASRTLPSPDRAVFYTSGRTSNEAAFLYQLFVRELGTNNLPDCSNLCHESSGVALGEALGVAKGSVLLRDFEKADCILIVGQNPGTNHPRMLSTLQDAARRGCPIIAVNPLREAGLLAFKDPQEVLGLLAVDPARHALPAGAHWRRLALLTGFAKALLERSGSRAEFSTTRSREPPTVRSVHRRSRRGGLVRLVRGVRHRARRDSRGASFSMGQSG